MPSHTNRTGSGFPNDTNSVGRQSDTENTTRGKTFAGGIGGGCTDTTPPAKRRHIANGEAVSGEVAPEPTPGGRNGDADTLGRAPGFLTAWGQRDSHAVTLAEGATNTSPDAGTPYQRVTWSGIRALVDNPAARPKDRAQFVILSTYAEHDGRTHAVQRERGRFCGLAVDIDTGNPSLADVAAAVDAVTGGGVAEIYSSSSATPHDRKWRVLIPLREPLAGVDYADTQTALFELFHTHGLVCDAALARPGQPVYLPNVPPKYRGPDGRPLFYESRLVGRKFVSLNPTSEIVRRRDAIRAQRAADDAAAAERAAAYKAQRLAHVAATGDDFEPIAHFNAHHTVADMLTRYGFQPHPRRGGHYRHPDSEKGSYGTEDRGDHWVCVSAWANNLNVGRPTRNNYRSGDAFDLFVAFEHGGNRSAAVRAYVAEVRPDRDGGGNVRNSPPKPDTPPPGRVEVFEPRACVSLEELRADLRADVARVLEHMPPLVCVTPEPGVGKTTAAVESLAGAFDQLTWAVATHDAAAETVARLHAAGHTDAAAIPPRDETTCKCWTADDAARLREEHPGHDHTLPMVDALRVGNPFLACLACPLSGLRKSSAPATPVDDFAEWADPFAHQPQAVAVLEQIDVDTTTCEYWRRKREAEAARITVMCQARLAKTEPSTAPVGTRRGLVVDEHATDVLLPRATFDVATLRATRDAMATAVGNWRTRKTRMRFSAAREREHELLGFAERVVDVATKIVEHMEGLEAAGERRVSTLPPLALPSGDIPKRAHSKLARLLIQGGLPEAFKPEAMNVIRRVAAGLLEAHNIYTEPVPGGAAHAQLVVHGRWWLADFSSMWVFDGSADMAAIRRAFPEVVEIAPRGVAPLAVEARQWWAELNPHTHPAVVVHMLELAIHQRGFKRAGVILCKSHRDVLFPVTRPRGDRVPEDKEPDAERIANWGGRNGRALANGTAEQRLARAHALVERVRALRQFIARDEHGRLLVEHHRGSGSRGTNRFLIGTDGGVVLGQTRCPPGEIAGYMLATGRGEAVEASNGKWGDVEGELPAVGGGTTTRRWRGYACPEWAEAARHLNRSALTQTVERFRTRLQAGVPVVVIAAEPTGLPVTDPPATIPEGVAAVVKAVRELVAGTMVVPSCEGGQPGDGAESGQPSTGGTGEGRGESRQRSTEHGFGGGGSIGNPSTEHTAFPILIDRLPIETAAVAGVAMDGICGALPGVSERTIRFWLADAVTRGLLVRTGSKRWTRYALPVLGAVPEPVDVAVVGRSGRYLEKIALEASSREQSNQNTVRPEPRNGASKAHDPHPPSVAALHDAATTGGQNNGLHATRTRDPKPGKQGQTRTPDGGRTRVGGIGGGVPPGLPQPGTSGGRVRGERSHVEAVAAAGGGPGAAENGGHETIPRFLVGGGNRTVSRQPGGIQPGPAGGILRGLIDTPDGPRFTDDAPLLTPPERSALVAAMLERWEHARTRDAPRDVARAEALAFLAGMFEHPPPVAA